MKQKITVNVLTIVNIIFLLSLYFMTPATLVTEMFESYEVPVPSATSTFIKILPAAPILGIVLLCFLIAYDLYFNKKRIAEKTGSYKSLSKITIIIMLALLVIIFVSFICFFLIPLVRIYQLSFLYEANNM